MGKTGRKPFETTTNSDRGNITVSGSTVSPLTINHTLMQPTPLLISRL